MIDWEPIKAIAIREWSICGGGGLERFYCVTDFKYLVLSWGYLVSSHYYSVLLSWLYLPLICILYTLACISSGLLQGGELAQLVIARAVCNHGDMGMNPDHSYNI